MTTDTPLTGLAMLEPSSQGDPPVGPGKLSRVFAHAKVSRCRIALLGYPRAPVSALANVLTF